MSRTLPALLLVTLLALVALVWLLSDGSDRPAALPGAGPLWQVSELLAAGEDDPFQRVSGPRPFTFPDDHGAHPDYRHEWWYLTGNLVDAAGRRYGFQQTFFRFGLTGSRERDADVSAWRTRDLYMAHFALSDAASGRFEARERFSRGVLGLAGARAAPFKVWLEEWSLHSSGAEFLPLQLQVAAGETRLDLVLDGVPRIVPQGAGGYSRKGPDPGNATHYYSITRLAAAGELQLPEGVRHVTGHAWLDREWGTSALAPGVVGWDWFALQLEDGRDLMLYRLRRADGSVDPFSAGSLAHPDGSITVLAADDFTIEVRATWRSDDGVAYPSRWRVMVPGESLQLDVVPLLADQELRLSVRYWEGAVTVSGTAVGRGYVELTGYADRPQRLPGR